ncbi:MAG: EamA family transporter [Actinomycetota bacterium]|jgi:drug/metabolite transporter (DMT)-like permease|nr:EamA family transporter [Actinomycetota bacterium]
MLLATVLALASALLHAGWNLLVKRSQDRLVSVWAQFAIGALPFLPVLVLAGPPEPVTYPYILLSALLQGAYAVALAKAYGSGDLSVTYPVARGVSPLLATVGGVVLLGEPLPSLGYLGVLLTSAGLLWIAFRGGRPRGLGWALTSGVLISGYTLSDAAGVRAGASTLRYTAALFVASALVLTAVVLTRRRPAAIVAALRQTPGAHVLNAVCAATAYVFVLAALRLAPVAYVATLREVSVVFGVLGGWLLLREPFGGARTAGAVVVAGGIGVLIASSLG